MTARATIRAMVVAPQPEAVEAGALVLKEGGNAVDAAIACALVQTVVDPCMAGIAGFGTMHLYLPERGIHECLDFHSRAPAAVREDMWADRISGEARDGFGFFLKGQVNEIGYQAIMTPGSLKAYAEAVDRYACWSWNAVLQPALDQARQGFVIRPHVYEFWSKQADFGRVPMIDKLRFSTTGRGIYFDSRGELKHPGDRVLNPDLRTSLERIATGGAELFYDGDLAAAMASDIQAHDGYLTRQDLSTYSTRRQPPLWSSYRDYRVAANPPPGGGIMVLLMLNILEHFDLSRLGHNTADYIHVVSEAMKYATIDKDRRIGDPEFIAVPVDELISKDYAARLANKIRDGERVQVERLDTVTESRDTTQICVADRQGNLVSMTHSLGMPSGVISDGLGYMYNGCMSVFDPRPGHAGSLAPGKSRFTAMSPTLVFKDDQPCLVIGAPGGTWITMGVLQGILNVLDFDMSMSDAVAAPRFTANSNTIDVSNRIPNFVTRELEARGHPVARSYLSYAFAGVHGIRIDGGILSGGADPGRDGMALGV